MPTPEAIKIPELIQQTRKRLHLSQVKFAQKLGVSFHSINRWENGKTHPLPLALKQIEALLYQMGEDGEDLLSQYFPQTEENYYDT